MATAILSHKFQGNFMVRQRLNGDSLVRSLIREGLFHKMNRVSPTTFNKLLTMLLHRLEVNKKQSSNASQGIQPILPEIILHCTLHYCAGGSIHDIHVFAGLSQSSLYRAVLHGIDVIITCPGLSIKFPVTLAEL
jgi:hypothetical protein